MDKIKLSYVKFVKFYRKTTIAFFQKILFKKNINPKKILIHRVAAFGDSVVSLPAISMIRKNYPNATIDILSTNCVGIDISYLIKDKKCVDNVYTFKKSETKQALVQMKNNKYDLYIEIPQNLNLIKSIRNIFRVRFAFSIDSAFGWDEGRVKSFLALQKKYLSPKREIDRFLDILQENGLKKEETIDFIINPNSLNIEEYLSENQKKNIVFLIGGKLESKKWPLEYWTNLAIKLDEKYNLSILGGADEYDEAQKIIKNSNLEIKNLCGKLDILKTADYLSKMDLVISQDTGAMHLAYAVETPVIALMSTRDLTNKWYPYGNNTMVLEKVLPCSFCLKKHCEDNICMKNISVDEVYENVLKYINRSVF